MEITNRLNLPLALVSAVSRTNHNREKCYSATTLNKDAKEVILTNRHFSEIKTDACENIWALFGTAVHAVLEDSQDDCQHEVRLESAVEGDGIRSGVKVTGIIDSLDEKNGVISDWKTASVWKVQFRDFEDWRRQGLTYAWLCARNGIKIDKCRFVALLKDHSKSKARYDSTYPQSPVYVYEFEVTISDLREHNEWIQAKIKEFEIAQNLTDDEIVPCTPESRWQTPSGFAVMKSGRKSAIRLFLTREDAQKFIDEKEEKGKGLYIEERIGEAKKCLDYCPCREFCNYYKEQTQCQTTTK